MASNRTRHALRVVTLVLGVAAVTASGAAAEQVGRSKTNGAYISVSGNDATGCIWSYLGAGRGGTKAAPTTWMSYDVYNGCTGEWIAYGRGTIANTALKVSNKGATLVITPTASANFYADGAIASIKLTLTANGLVSYSYSGHSRVEYSGHVYQSHGAWNYRTASVAGTLLGFTVGEMSGEFGEGRDKYIEIERGSK
jgi:hypothetical protein